MRSLLLCAALCVPAFAAPVPKESKKFPALQLRGEWALVAMESEDGQMLAAEDLGDIGTLSIAFDGHQFSCGTADTPRLKGHVVYDFHSTPNRVDLGFEETCPCIFRFDDEGLLHFGRGVPGRKHHGAFRCGDGNDHFVFKRLGGV